MFKRLSNFTITLLVLLTWTAPTIHSQANDLVGWDRVASPHDRTTTDYCKTKSITREGNDRVRAWFKRVYTPPVFQPNIAPDSKIAYALSFEEFDCVEKTTQVRAYVMYDAQGKNLVDWDIEDEPKLAKPAKSIVPDSIGDKKVQYVCTRR